MCVCVCVWVGEWVCGVGRLGGGGLGLGARETSIGPRAAPEWRSLVLTCGYHHDADAHTLILACVQSWDTLDEWGGVVAVRTSGVPPEDSRWVRPVQEAGGAAKRQSPAKPPPPCMLPHAGCLSNVTCRPTPATFATTNSHLLHALFFP